MGGFTDFCRPALVYIALGVFSCFLGIIYKFPFSAIAIKLTVVFLWAWVLNMLCEKGHTRFAWFVVALPFLFMLALFGEEPHVNPKENEGTLH